MSASFRRAGAPRGKRIKQRPNLEEINEIENSSCITESKSSQEESLMVRNNGDDAKANVNANFLTTGLIGSNRIQNNSKNSVGNLNKSLLPTVFKRRGTKPWTSGNTLTSTGLRELDAICGGGQPLGTSILIEEDRWTQDLGVAIAKYWAAEALSQDQRLFLVTNNDLNLDQSDNSECVPSLLDVDVTKPSKLFHPQSNLSHVAFNQGLNIEGANAFLHTIPSNLNFDKHDRANRTSAINSNAKNTINSNSIANNIPYVNDNTISKVDAGARPDFSIIEEEDFEDGDSNDNHKDDDNFIDNDNASMDKLDEGLKNAWQYKLSIQNERLGVHQTSSSTKPQTRSLIKPNKHSEKPYCHSYDLNGRIIKQIHHLDDSIQKALQRKNIHFFTIPYTCKLPTCHKINNNLCTQSRNCGLQLFRICLQRIRQELTRTPDTVIRLLFINTSTQITSIALPLLITHIRTHSIPVVILLTVRSWLCSTVEDTSNHHYQHHLHHPVSSTTMPSRTSLLALQRCSDAVFACEGFESVKSPPPPEFKDLAGIFSISKMALQTTSHFSNTHSKGRPLTNRYGMKRDRRKLHIQMLHLPPEDYGTSAATGGGGGGSGRSLNTNTTDDSHTSKTALIPGLSCATSGGISSSKQSLDF